MGWPPHPLKSTLDFFEAEYIVATVLGIQKKGSQIRGVKMIKCTQKEYESEEKGCILSTPGEIL